MLTSRWVLGTGGGGGVVVRGGGGGIAPFLLRILICMEKVQNSNARRLKFASTAMILTAFNLGELLLCQRLPYILMVFLLSLGILIIKETTVMNLCHGPNPP